MLRIGDRYRIPDNGVVLEVQSLFNAISGDEMYCKVVDIGFTNKHNWSIKQTYTLRVGWFESWGCERLPRKSEEFQNLYDKLNADLL